MTLARATLRTDVQGVTVVDLPGDLSSFLEPASAATIWRRTPPSGIVDWLKSVPLSALPEGRGIVPAGDVYKAAEEFCTSAGTPAGEERTLLLSDMAALADIFAGLMEAPFLRVRLQPVTANACRKFHIDTLRARLLCTYRGPGTQYGTSNAGADPKRVFSVPTGAPVLLRGTLWPNKPASHLVHRSPPIEGTGVTRLVFVLDPVFNLDEEDW